MTPAQELGMHLRDLREQRHMTQWQVAQRLSYTTAQFVSNWERGVSRPPYDVLGRLAVIYGVPAKSLVDLIFRAEEQALQLQKRQVLQEVRA